MTDNQLKQRCEKFLSTFKTPKSKFCQMIDLSCSAFYQWQRGELVLTQSTEKRISDFLQNFGF